MDRRFLTVLGVSLVFALVVSSIFYQMSAKGNGSQQKVPAAQELKDVVVAVRPLPIGGLVKTGDVKIVKIAAEAFPKNAFSKDTEVLDRPVVSNILPDEPILEGRLGQRGTQPGLQTVIPVGMRAVTVRVNDVTGVAGYVLPGARVDVLVTGHPPGADQTVTRTFLQNMLVIATGQAIQPDARGQAIQAPTVTLLATPDQAELLTLANSEGHIQLILRNGTDQGLEKTKGSKIAELYKSQGGNTGNSRAAAGNSTPSEEDEEKPKPKRRVVVTQAAVPPPAPVVVIAPPPPPPPDQVVVIRGTQKTVETVRPASGSSK